MSRSRGFRGALVLVLSLALALTTVAMAVAQEDAAETAELISAPVVSPDGVYGVVGTTNTGKQVSTNVLVTSLSGDRVQFQANVMGFPVTTSGKGSWNAERTEVTVPVGVFIWGIADASGSITLRATQTGWEFTGAGSGTAMGASGSATAAGFMAGGVAPTPAEVADASGVPENVRATDPALSVLVPDDVGDMDTDAQLQELAVILFAVFVTILLQMILGIEIL